MAKLEKTMENTNNMNEEDFKKGALPHKIDVRDYRYPQAVAPYNWSKLFNIEDKVGVIKVKNQYQSYSCGGQAWSYYMGVLASIDSGSPYNEDSSKYIYSQTFELGGGSDGRKNSDLCAKQGVSSETLCLSYHDNITDEAFMTRPQDITPEARQNAQTDMATYYGNITTTDIESVAQAIVANNGCILGVDGQNNGTWTTNNPQKPSLSNGSNIWRHWVFAGRIRMFNGKKQIGFLNSWGETVGDKGWQYIDEDYFTSGHVFAGWVLTHKKSALIVPAPAPWYVKFLALLKASGVTWDGRNWVYIKS